MTIGTSLRSVIRSSVWDIPVQSRSLGIKVSTVRVSDYPMVEIPDSLRCVFSATVRERDGAYVVDIPSGEIDHEVVTSGEPYRIAIFEPPTITESEEPDSQHSDRAQRPLQTRPPEPPVEEGEIRDVTIETVGDQGDGIAKVDRGYVVIVPGTQPGEQPTVEIKQVQQNVAFASVVDPDYRTL